MKEIRIGNRYVGIDHAPLIVAEMSGNHNQSIKRAIEIVEAAAHAGVDALKIQTYTADTMTLDIKEDQFRITDSSSPWFGSSLYELYQQAHTPWDWHKPIFDRCKDLGILCFSTPFDNTAVDFLETLNVPCYKIASFENTDIRLIRKVAKTGKPVLISTGMVNEEELSETVKEAKCAGCRDLILLKCTSTYPASPDNSNIQTIPDMRERYKCEVGLSDHTLGLGVSVASISLGATVIEKHFTIARADGGIDSAFSMEPEEMQRLVVECKSAWQALGKVRYEPTEKEKVSLLFRRSLYISKDIKAGEIITEDNLRSIRPGYGLPPKHYDKILGKRLNRDVEKGTPVSWDIFE